MEPWFTPSLRLWPSLTTKLQPRFNTEQFDLGAGLIQVVAKVAGGGEAKQVNAHHEGAGRSACSVQ